jgi:hypothetical protein
MYASARGSQPHVSSRPLDHSTVPLPSSPCSGSSKNTSVRFGGYKNHAARAHRRSVAVAADMSDAGDRSASHPLSLPWTKALFFTVLCFTSLLAFPLSEALNPRAAGICRSSRRWRPSCSTSTAPSATRTPSTSSPSATCCSRCVSVAGDAAATL